MIQVHVLAVLAFRQHQAYGKYLRIFLLITFLMNNKRVLISVGQRFNRQLINYSLQRYPEVEIVGRSLNAIRIMSLIAQRKPHVWVHSFDEGPDYETISAYIRSIAPELAIVRIIPDDEFGYLQIPLRRVSDLVSQALHHLDIDSSETLIASSSPM